MALPNAADPIFDDHQEQESSSSTSSTSITIFENKQQRRNFFGNVQYLDVFLYLMIFFFYFAFFANLLFDGRTLYGLLKTCDLEFYRNYYIVKTLSMSTLGYLFMSNYFVPPKLYILKVVSIITGILFIFDFIVMANIDSVAIQKYHSCVADEKCLTDPKLHTCVELIAVNIINASAMFLFSIVMSLKILGVKACLAYYVSRRNE